VVGGQLGVPVGHPCDAVGHERGRDHLLLGAEEVGVAHGAPDDASQHVAPVLVGRDDAVGDEEGGGAGVVGDDLEGDVGALVDPQPGPGEPAGGLDEPAEHVGLPDRVLAGEGGEHALEAGARVHVLRGERLEAAVGAAEGLDEHQVPDLDVAVLGGGVGRAGGGAEVGAVVPEDLRARPARADVAHLPEVVLVEALDALAREPDLVDPALLGLVVADVDRHPHAVAVEAQHLGEQLPRPADGLGLEVVVEAPVPQHLEEAEVPAGATDGVEVVVLAAGPHALLDVDHPGRAVRDRLLTQEVRDELHHPRVGEHRGGGVRRDEAGRGDDRVLARREELQEGAAQLGGGRRGGHGGPAYRWALERPGAGFEPRGA
jgi:hypothetical protein